MELKINIEYSQVLKLVKQLSKKEIYKLLEDIQSGNDFEIKTQTTSSFQKLLKNGPTWTDEQYNSFLEGRDHFNKLGAS